jgi:hypothetical protein
LLSASQSLLAAAPTSTFGVYLATIASTSRRLNAAMKRLAASMLSVDIAHL